MLRELFEQSHLDQRRSMQLDSACSDDGTRLLEYSGGGCHHEDAASFVSHFLTRSSISRGVVRQLRQHAFRRICQQRMATYGDELADNDAERRTQRETSYFVVSYQVSSQWHVPV